MPFSITFQVFIFLGFIIQIMAQLGNYSKYKVYDVTPVSSSQIDFVKKLCRGGYECFNEITDVGSTQQILVKPEQEAEFYDFNYTGSINSKYGIPNLQVFIEAQIKPMQDLLETASLLNFTWDRYRSLEEIYHWLNLLAVEFMEVRTIVIGRTHEGRDVKGITIDFKEGLRKHNYYGMIEGGIHGREWISPATVTWIIKEFMTSHDAEIRLLAEAFIWHIFPVVNPDGYAYTFSHDRMWKRNRSQNNSYCIGVDLNRNFNYKWVGMDSNVSCQYYPGPFPESEPETRAITRHVLKLRKSGTLLYYFSFHSYSQLVMFPYTHGNQKVKNYFHLYRIVKSAAEKMKSVMGNTYKFGSASELHYDVSGSSIDWVRAKGKVPIAILFELRDNGLFGYTLPPPEIIPNNAEVMASLVEIDKVTRKLRYYVLMNFEIMKPVKRRGKTNASSLTAVDISSILLFSGCSIVIWGNSPL